LNFIPTPPIEIKTKKDVLIYVVLPLVIFGIIFYSLLPVMIDSIFGNYYETVDGITYHCYTGSDYLLCDEVADGIGYD
jgi:hypothetical protein